MRMLLAAAAAIAIAGCLGAEATDTEEAPVRVESRAVLSAPTGPEGVDEDYEVFVGHESLPPETVAAIVGNLRLGEVDLQFEVNDEVDLRKVPPSDLHWLDPSLHEISVRIEKMTPAIDAKRLEWFWADHRIIDLYCPPGHGG